MKGMVDALRDLDKPVPDCTLVLNIFQGLNKRYDHLKTFLKRVIPFPSSSGSYHSLVLNIRNDLLLKEITVGSEDAFDSATIFAASGGQ
jgi:hypothetical protein